MPEPAASTPTLSLAARLVIGLTGLLVVGGVALSFAAFSYGKAAAREAYDRLLLGAAQNIAASISVIDGAPEVDLPVSAFALLALAEDDRIAYQLRGPRGQVLTGYDGLPLPPRGVSDTVLYDADFLGEPARFIRVVRRFAERRFSGQVEVIVGQTLRARTELAVDIIRNALGGLAIGGLAMLTFAVIVVRRALRPLDRLAASLADRDPQDLTPINAAVPREVHAMVEAINGFMGRLERQFSTMKSLISDTAHQLRTPVAALRAQADLAADEEDPAHRAEIVARIHRGTVRLSRLLDQMLSRALVIHRGDAARRGPVDLRDIALDIFETGDYRDVAPKAEVHLDIGNVPVLVLADALSLGEAAKNLFWNALAHGKPPVTVGAMQDGDTARLYIRDAGSGPPPELRARLGTRFSTCEAGGTHGTGLGLSIAAAVAEAFGGALEMGQHDDGFEVAIVLPAVPGT